MWLRGLFHISLARKCQLLFGSAVLLIIAAALFVPGYYMEKLVEELSVRRARHLATLAYAWVDPSSTDWQDRQQRLSQWWVDNAATLGLPQEPQAIPRLICLREAVLIGPSDVTRITSYLTHIARGSGWCLRRLGLGREPMLVGWLVAAAADRVPLELRDRFREHGLAFLKATARLGAAGTPLARLDDFQAEAVLEMRANALLNEKTQTIGSAGQRPVYRLILAVRTSSSPGPRRPLVGIIDVVFTAPDTLVWTRFTLLLAGLLAGFLAILVFYLISQKLILAPVRDLKDLVGEVAAGDLSARSDIATGDEFEELATAFNDMLGQLERSRNELETINRSLDTKLGQLAETNVALYESNRLKTESIANVSHELRTPLTSIIGFADLLEDLLRTSPPTGGPVDTTRARRFAAHILTSGRQLLETINDLLDVARIETGSVELHRTAFSLREMCEAMCDFMKPLTDKKGLTVTAVLDDRLPTMTSDAGKLRQILYNLLSNAIKYTPEGGTVGLEAGLLDGGQRVRLAVTDNGPGIAPEDRERIFEKFRQLDASVTREHSGTGLGLPISRELCMMLGGMIRLESDLGRGSRFIVELPVECPETTSRPLPSLT